MLHNIKPSLRHPPDFEAFWDKTLDALNACDPAVARSPGDETDGLRLDTLTFASLGGARVHGYLLHWTDAAPRPLVVHSHGYGSQYTVQAAWARQGLHVLGVDIRGFGRSVGAVAERSPWGYMLTGATSPEDYVLRGAVCDYVRAVQVGRRLLDARVERAVLYGYSFAGALAVMAEAVMQHQTDLLVAGVPTFGWSEGRQFFVRMGSGSEINRYLEARPGDAEDLMVVLRYFDPVHFAPYVACPALVGVGLEDDVVPPSTVYAIANHLGGPHEVMTFPVSHSASPLEALWDRFDQRWIGLARDGVPADFGGRTVRVEA
jgi:cephalosporin-C deacetylase-like acetyl esterase